MTRRSVVYSILLGATCLSSPVFAQAVFTSPPPTNFLLDGNFVDRASGAVSIPVTELSIGPAASGLQLISYHNSGLAPGGPKGTNWDLVLWDMGSTVEVATPRGISEGFTHNGGGNYTSQSGNGSTLIKFGGVFTFTSTHGDTITFDYNTMASGESGVVRATSSQLAAGQKATLTWVSTTYCSDGSSGCSTGTMLTRVRLQSVQSSEGYQLHYNYNLNTTPTHLTAANWSQLDSVTAINLTIDYCDPAGGTCSLTQTAASTSYAISTSGSTTTETVTDPMGRVSKYITNTSARTFSVQRPTSSTPNFVYSFDTTPKLTSLARDGNSYTYSLSTASNVLTVQMTNPAGKTSSTTADTVQRNILSVTNELNNSFTYSYDSGGLLDRITAPEGNYVDYTRNTRGQITQTDFVPKPGSGLATITTSATYPANCDDGPAFCNYPNTLTDANGNVTKYTWSTKGNLNVIEYPSAGAGIRFQSFGYSDRMAYFKDSSGTIQPSGVSVSVRVSGSTCRTVPNCASNSADRTSTTYAYGANNTPNNLLLTSTSIGAANASSGQIATTTFDYDAAGNQVSIDGPLSNDTTVFRYNLDREIEGIIGPDPDGGGVLLNRAQRLTYNLDGQVTLVEIGTTPGQTNSDWASFNPLQKVATTYNGAAQQVQTKVQAGTTTYNLTEYSYDTVGRLSCVATRMNPGLFGSATDACSLTSPTGSFGQDRIAKYTYDDAGQVLDIATGFGTSSARTYVAYSYTSNGLVATFTDANSNLTTYTYNGFDRLWKTAFPNKTGGGSSSTDDEELTYDANGNITVRQIRNGSTIGYTYDALNRLTSMTLPTGTGNPNPAYGYDLIGNLLTANNTQSGPPYSNEISMAYDAFGQKISETTKYNNAGAETKLMEYDLAGRLTKFGWSDLWATYEYNNANDLTAIRENGGSLVLASYLYNDLGIRTNRTLGNSTTINYTYDAISRLTGVNLGGSGTGTAITLSNYNPANQIGSRVVANDAYAWRGAIDQTVDYTPNGLNQYSGITGLATDYDPKGNMIKVGGRSYSFGAENTLTTANQPAKSFWHDALNRMTFITSTSQRFDYAGDQLVGLYVDTPTSHTLLRRYIYEPGANAPTIWYEGSGTGNRRYFDADELGSIIRVTNSTGGTTLGINTYDEYGVPGVNNFGRFQYGGYIWLPEIGMYLTRNRIYAQGIGRFTQPDPIGYDDGPNMYAYVHNDPVNRTDPLGLGEDCGDGSDDICVTAKKGNDSSGFYFDPRLRPPFFRFIERAEKGGGGADNKRTRACSALEQIAESIADRTGAAATGAGYVAVALAGAGAVTAPIPGAQGISGAAFTGAGGFFFTSTVFGAATTVATIASGQPLGVAIDKGVGVVVGKLFPTAGKYAKDAISNAISNDLQQELPRCAR